MAAKVKKRLAKKTSASASRGRGRARCNGITRRLDAQFTKTPDGPCNRKFRKKAIYRGIFVDNQLTRYAKDPSVALCPDAQASVYIRRGPLQCFPLCVFPL